MVLSNQREKYMRMFEADITPHGTWGIMISNPTEEERIFLRRIVMSQGIHNDDYKIKNKAGAFIQADDETYVMVEFWIEAGVDEFIKYVNNPKVRRESLNIIRPLVENE
jgi:hypothetical protein